MLQEAFSCGYQGANPNQAEILFVGLDANFAEDIASEGELYQDVLAYLFDGPKYWETHDTHHPFLLHPSAADGWRYHSRFSQIGLTARDAHRVSFVELLHVATVGRRPIRRSDLDQTHIARLQAWMTGGNVRFVFASRMVGRWLQRMRLFEELRSPATETASGLLGWTLRSTGQQLLLHSHFSAWGCQCAQLQKDLLSIRALVRPAAP
jgi:hypothetical protein